MDEIRQTDCEGDVRSALKRKSTEYWSNILINEAVKIAREIKADAALFYMDSTKDIGPFLDLKTDIKLILLTKRDECVQKASSLPVYAVKIPNVQLSRTACLKVGFLSAISKGILCPGDVIVCVGGVPEQGYMDTLMIVHTGFEAELFRGGSMITFPSDFRPDVFDRLLNLAIELASEGREGKPVGTIFVLGDHENVLNYSRQLVFNPFEGRPEHELNLADETVQESLKEFAAIDGAFVIRDDGVVLAAGRYLNVAYTGEALSRGLGARHMAAAAITYATKAIAIAISESTGKVTVFKDGKVLTEIERLSERVKKDLLPK